MSSSEPTHLTVTSPETTARQGPPKGEAGKRRRRRRPRSAFGVPAAPAHYRARAIAGVATAEDLETIRDEEEREQERAAVVAEAGMRYALRKLARKDARLAPETTRQLWLAAREDDDEPFKELVEQEPSLASLSMIRDSRGRTPLHVAARNGCVKVVRACLRPPPAAMRKAGAAPAAAPAWVLGKQPTADELKQREQQRDAARNAARAFDEWRRSHAVLVLTSCATKLGYTPFHYAVIGGSICIVEHMLHYFGAIGTLEAELYSTTSAGDNSAALAAAYEWGHVRSLLEKAMKPFEKVRAVRRRREERFEAAERRREEREREKQRLQEEEQERERRARELREERARAEREAQRRRLEEEQRQRDLRELRAVRVQREKKKIEERQEEVVAQVKQQRAEARERDKVTLAQAQAELSDRLTRILAAQREQEAEREAALQRHQQRQLELWEQQRRREEEEEAARRRYPELGIEVTDGASFGMLGKRDWGCARVVSVAEGKPAEAAGIVPGDAVVAVGALEVRALADLRCGLDRHGQSDSSAPLTLVVRSAAGVDREVVVLPGLSAELCKGHAKRRRKAAGALWLEDAHTSDSGVLSSSAASFYGGPWKPPGVLTTAREVPPSGYRSPPRVPAPHPLPWPPPHIAGPAAAAASGFVLAVAVTVLQTKPMRRSVYDLYPAPNSDGDAQRRKKLPLWKQPVPSRDGPEYPPVLRATHRGPWCPSRARGGIPAW